MARLCPHCNNRAQFGTPFTGSGRWGAEQRYVGLSVLSCQECGGVVISLINHDDDHREFLVFPAAIPTVSEYVNKNVAADYISAVNCMAISENKAAAAMFRRSLQQIMIDKKAIDGLLWKQIDDLAAKGIITNDIKDWAHEIRYWGNDGAHPATDYLDDITDDEITEVKEFLERVFEYVYIMPSKLEASRTSRKAKQNATP